MIRPNRWLVSAVCALSMVSMACDDRAPPIPSGSILESWVWLARRDHPDVDAAFIEREVERLAEEWRRLAEGLDAIGRADAFRRLLFEVEGYQVVDALTDPRFLHAESVLRDRRGYCLSLSMVALAVAERVGAPLFGVVAPNHFYVRYDDGDARRALELTRGGVALDEESERRLAGDWYDQDSIYLRNLTPAEVAAVLLHNRGYVALHQERQNLAESDLRAAIDRLPRLPEAHRNLGVLLGEREQWDEAVAEFERALELFPGDVDAMINLAICRRARGELDEAMDDLKLAGALAPGHARVAELLADWERDEQSSTADLEPGLLGTYFKDRRLREAVATRVDRVLDFDWQNAAPIAGAPRDGFGVRWEGFLKAPGEGDYTVFVVANDGVRIDLGGERIIDNWQAMGYENYYGFQDVHLSAGLHALRIEFFDDRGGARLMCRLGQDGVEKPLDLSELLFHRRR